MAERTPSNDQAAFGVFPQLQRNRSKQDREAAKNVPIDLARGAVAGVLGAPGDIESLVRMLPYLDEKTVLPTSEDIEKRLPLRSETPVSKAATGLGILGGGFYTGPGSPLRVAGALPGAIKHGAEEFAKASVAGVPHVVKPKGGNWFGTGMDDAMKGLKRYDAPSAEDKAWVAQHKAEWEAQPDSDAKTRALRAINEDISLHARNEALNNWVDRNLTNYVKKEMATPEDPVRKLAEQGIVSFPVAEDPRFWALRGERFRKELGGTEMAKSDLAKQWENRTDAKIRREKAGQHQDFMHLAPGMYSKEDEWIKKLAPETDLYDVRLNPRDLGFDHILDVLRQDVASGRIRPEQLNKVSMEQAVRRTAEYDQEMARKMAEAQLKATEGMPIHKTYPEGYKWIELGPSKELPEGWTSKPTASGGVAYYDPQGVRHAHPNADAVAEALKYEGNTMGHCVGGYCPDVLEGRSRIFSLRDAKGEPHVTIEVAPHNPNLEFAYAKKNLPELHAKYSANRNDYENNWPEFLRREAPELLNATGEEIVQIKGKQNAKPKEDYLPYVQDFVKGGKWSNVGDFHHTGLTERGSVFTPDELRGFTDLGQDVPMYLSKEDIAKLRQARGDAPPPEGMKRGGVAISKNPDTMMLELGNKRMKEGGAEDDTKPYFGGAGTKKYAAAKKRAEDADVNLLKDPKTYAAVMGLLGEAPDEMGFSVLHPDAQGIKDVADPAFYAGTALGVAPLMKAFKAPAMALGRAGEKYAEKVVPQIMERGGIGADILGGLAQGTRSNVYLPHTPKKPDPNVGSRFKTEHVGNLAPKHEFDVEKNQGSSVMSNPWDLTSRGEKVLEVSDTPMIEPIITEGGHDFARDLAHIGENIGGASGRQIAERMQDRVNDAYFANMLDKGTGRVYTMPSTMDITGSNYSTMPTDIIMDFFKQAELKPKDVNRITDDLRTFMFETERGKFKNAAPVGSPEFLRQLREGGEGFSAGDLRKGFMDRMSKAEYQKMLGYNIEDVYGAIHDPALKGVPKGFVGNTMIETSPFAEVKPSTHQSYDTANAGKYAGSMPSMPLELMMPDLYQYMETKFLSDPRYHKLTPNQLRTMIVNTIEKRGSVISQPINQRVVDNVMRYKEGLKQGHFKPNDYEGIMEFMRRTGGYKDGGTVKKAEGGAITGDDLIIEERPL